VADDSDEFSPDEGFIASARRDHQSVTADWQFLEPFIDGGCHARRTERCQRQRRLAD
jgi:hypothetical protein